ncbi:MAG: hypothetical protein ACI8Z1_003256 [Candidatus Azotimanducaceae bacterium]|jgi:hypothetical protein
MPRRILTRTQLSSEPGASQASVKQVSVAAYPTYAATTRSDASTKAQTLFGPRPGNLNFDSVGIKEEDDTEIRTTADGTELFKTNLIHPLYG